LSAGLLRLSHWSFGMVMLPRLGVFPHRAGVKREELSPGEHFERRDQFRLVTYMFALHGDETRELKFGFCESDMSPIITSAWPSRWQRGALGRNRKRVQYDKWTFGVLKEEIFGVRTSGNSYRGQWNFVRLRKIDPIFFGQPYYL